MLVSTNIRMLIPFQSSERPIRIFSYCRVSTTEQAPENQILAIRQKGYKVADSRGGSEIVSGSVEAMKREKFRMLGSH